MRMVLTATSGPHQGKQWTFDEPNVYILGRDEDSHVCLKADRHASRKHCSIELKQHGVWIIDTGSQNGTFLNSRKVQSPVQLSTGDNIFFGRTTLSVSFNEVDEPTVENLPPFAVPGFSLVKELSLSADRQAFWAVTDMGDPVILHFVPVQVQPDKSGQEEINRLLREAVISNYLNSHPKILPFRGQGMTKETIWFATGFVDAEPLDQYVARKDSVSLEEAVDIILQTAEILSDVHQMGVIHRSLRPESIWVREVMRGKAREVYLVDLTSAKWYQEKDLQTITTVSNRGYPISAFTAKESIIDFKKLDLRSDVYALGCIFYYLLGSCKPYKDEGDLVSSILEQRPVPVQTIIPGLPIAIVEIIAKSMAEDVLSRYQSVKELILALQKYQAKKNDMNGSRQQAPDAAIFEMQFINLGGQTYYQVTQSDMDKTLPEPFVHPYPQNEWLAMSKALRTKYGEQIDNPFSEEQWKTLVQHEVAKTHTLKSLDTQEIKNVLLDNIYEKVGRRLYEALFPQGSKARTAFESTLTRAQRQRQCLHFRLIFSMNTTLEAAYPWELIYQDAHLIRIGDVELIRYVTFQRAISELKFKSPLQILFIPARPSDQTQLPSLEEQKAASQALYAKLGPRQVIFDVLEIATRENAVSWLTSKQYDIVHFDGHGAFGYLCPRCNVLHTPLAKECVRCGYPFADDFPQGFLLFENLEGKTDYIGAQILQAALARSGVQLAMLSACQSGRVGGESLFGGVGPAMIQIGIPAVVSMQLPLSTGDAVLFIRYFYQKLAEGFSLPEAVGFGRQQIQQGHSNPQAWFIPSLYLRSREIT